MNNRETQFAELPVLAKQNGHLRLNDGHGRRLERALDPRANVVVLFEQHALATPDKIACYAGTRNISYGDLNIQANHLARHLINLGIGHGSVVGVFLERSIETLVALLAIFKAGGAYVPLDIHYPQNYLDIMINTAELSLILCSKATRTILPPVTAAVFTIDLLETSVSEDASNLGLELTLDQLAYVLFTSGSTGTPKGVEVPHAQLINCLQNYCDAYPLDPQERVAQRTTTAFAVSVKELFAALVSGASVVILADDISKDPARLAAAISDYGITRLSIVPSHLDALLSNSALVALQLAGLRYCITAGEPLSKSLAQRVKQLLPCTRLLNNYGCTEFNDITYQDVSALEGSYAFVPVGLPIANTQVYVLDAQLRPVPVGETGELCVAGQSLPKGYRGRPDLTAEKFIKHPFSTVAGARLFKTGDHVKRLPCGALEYIGRQDFQIKVRGFRVDARQVEYVMGLYPGLTTPIASYWAEGQQLVGYFTAKPASVIDTRLLKQFLNGRLPGYMVPDVLLRLDSLPRLPNGKVDRRNLPSPVTLMGDRSHRVALETELEKALVDVWAKILNVSVESIGRDDNFFDLVGHSLAAMRLLAVLKVEFLFDMSLQDFFDLKDLGELAQNVDMRIALVLGLLEES